MHAADVSSHQSLDLRELDGVEPPVEAVCVRMYLPWEKPSVVISQAQAGEAEKRGLGLLVYAWAYQSADPRQTIREACELARRCGVNPKVLWLDCETYAPKGIVEDPGPDVEWLREAFDEGDSLDMVLGVGIYTGLWWLKEYLKDWSEFTTRPIWLADYKAKRWEDVEMPEGWPREKLLGWQYQGEVIDLDWFRREAVG